MPSTSLENKPKLLILDLGHKLATDLFNTAELLPLLKEQGIDVFVYTDLPALVQKVQSHVTSAGSQQAFSQSDCFIAWLDVASDAPTTKETLACLKSLNTGVITSIPWVVLADQLSITRQLAALQAGACHYWLPSSDLLELVAKFTDWLDLNKRQPYRVVMVDDNEIVLEIQTALLCHADIEVWPTENPLELPELLNKVKPDVLVLDLHMPQVCGSQLAWTVRQTQSAAELPIIFVSGEDDLGSQMLALKQGGDDFLLKPVNPHQFTETVKMRAERARQHNRLQSKFKRKLYEQSREHQALNKHAIVSVANRAGDIVSVNDQFCQISGYQREELIGYSHRVVKSNRHAPDFYKALWQKISSGEVWQGEICNLTKQGEEYWVKSTITPFMNDEGHIYQYVSIRTDITQIKKLELAQQARLFEQGERVKEWRCLNQIMELLANDALDDHELLYQVVNSIPAGWRHPSDTCALVELNGVSYATSGFYETQWCQYCEIELEQIKGQLIVCRFQPDLAEMHDGYGILLEEEQRLLNNIGLQISQAFKRREAKRAMQKAQQQAERANRAKSGFLASMSHELRTPLNSIIGFSQLLELSQLSDSQKKQVHTIGASGKHLLSLINDVLEFAKLESGKLSLSIEPVEVRPIIEQVAALSDSHAYANNVKISLTEDTQRYFIKADPVRFKQIVLNLTSNAIKYNRSSGKVVIRWQAEQQQNKAWLLLQVEDTGYGVDPKDFPRLFEPFERLGQEGSSIEGTGIGLSITKDLVKQMAGQIEVESELDVGTIFKVRFPLDESVVSLGNNQLDKFAANTEAKAKKRVIQNTLKVLYVEDNPANMKLMADILQLIEGAELRISPSAQNGLAQAQAWLPNLILLDINLPDMNGDQAISHFRALPGYATVQPTIYAVTANVLEDQKAHYRDCGFDDIIAKPFEIERLIEHIEAVRKRL